jgi:gliding motility-associated-like protein
MKQINYILHFNLKLIYFLLLTFLTISNVRASHILGSEITYANMDGNRYKFTLKIYRDCNECKINGSGGGLNNNNCNEVPPLIIRGAFGTSYSTSQLGIIDLVRVEINDITPLCSKEVSRCKGNLSAPFGFEVHTFEGFFDFGGLISQSYCQFDVSVSMSSRSAKINRSLAEQNFFNYTFLNLCNGSHNTSISYFNPPGFHSIVNQTNFSAQGIVNNDNDSLSFKLRPALVNRMNNVIYENGRSFSLPLNVFCQNSQSNCSANINSSPAEGFFLSPNTGDLIFTPIINNQASVIVVECEEWKKDYTGKFYLSGITRRDFFTETILTNNNLPEIKSVDLNLEICEKENKSIDIEIVDMPVLGVNSDTVDLMLLHSLPGVKLLKTAINVAPFFSYSLEINHSFNIFGKQLITLVAMDNHCYISGISSKTISINFLKSRVFEASISNIICNEVTFNPALQLSENFNWKLIDGNGSSVVESKGKRLIAKVVGGDNYNLEVTKQSTSEYCALNYKETFFINEIEYPSLTLETDDFLVCKNEWVDLSPRQFKATPGFKFYINNTTVNSFPYDVIIRNSQDFIYKIVQTNGCSASASLKISVLPGLNYNLEPIDVCLNEFKPNINLPYPEISNYTLLSSIELKSLDGLLNPIENNQYGWNLYLKENKSIQSFLVYDFIDTNGCKTIDTVKITVLDTPMLKPKVLLPVCSNQFPVKLPAETNEKWQSLNPNFVVDDENVLRLVGEMGDLNLLIQSNGKCTSKIVQSFPIFDTTALQSNLPNVFSICENNEYIDLDVLPIGGRWKGENIVGERLILNNVNKSSHLARYEYENEKKCKSSFLQKVNIDRLPLFLVTSNKDSICYGDVLHLKSNASENTSGYWFTNGNGRFDNPNQLITDYFPSFEDVKNGHIQFNYTIQTNLSCGNISNFKKVFIKDGPKGDISFTSTNNQCETTEFVFNSTFKNVDKQFWYINDSLIDVFDYAFPLKIKLNSGLYMVKTSVLDGSCSAIAFSNNIEVLPKPSLKFISNPSYKLSKEMPRLFLKDQSYCKFGFSVQWYFNDSFISSEREFSFLPRIDVDSFKIKLIATSLKGDCMDSITRGYKYIPNSQLFIPDAFSPDSKGPDDNNVFKVVGPPLRKYQIEIFNKFGEKVFMSNNQNDYWDGTYKRQICMPGVYFYKIVTKDNDGIDRDYSGTITLIR